eukprot:gnl/MRDRNA2_/MRDRNA2_195221_c0_seq1.p1 gnl/MRDRNA2_/MRDRNA2_195221_c0~~gnl/MRDRNA2_/MRDRNA2_195221_c0_seq1.p1  ORF type:complete len:323 (+),score=39.83 gnl/MRDRNA2_/MRDRNA2_195221_c0_seq1:132-971(+)
MAYSCVADSDHDIWGSNQKSGQFMEAIEFFTHKLNAGLTHREVQCSDSCPAIQSTLLTVNHHFEPELLVNGSVDYVSTLWAVDRACAPSREDVNIGNHTFKVLQNATDALQCTKEHPETCNNFSMAFQNVSNYCSCPCARAFLEGAIHMGTHGGIDKMALDSPHLPETCRVINSIMTCVKKPQNYCACNGFRKKKIRKEIQKGPGGVTEIVEEEIWEPDGSVQEKVEHPLSLRPPEVFAEACAKAGHPMLWLLDIALGEEKHPDCATLSASALMSCQSV